MTGFVSIAHCPYLKDTSFETFVVYELRTTQDLMSHSGLQHDLRKLFSRLLTGSYSEARSPVRGSWLTAMNVGWEARTQPGSARVRDRPSTSHS